MYPTKKLSQICEILDRLRKPVTASDRISGPYPYYGATGIQDYVDKYIFDEDLILVGEDGAKWGKGENTAFKISGKTWVNNHAHVLRLDKNQIEENWIIHFLNFSDLTPYISGATVKKLNQERLRSIEIPLPPLSTQSRIVARLDSAFASIDEQISLLRANIADVENVRKSVLEESFQSGEYEMKELGEISEIITGNTPPTKFPEYYNGTYLWAGPGDFGDFKVIDFTTKTLSEKGINEGKARLIQKGAVMLVAIGATIGKVGIAGQEMSTNQQINSFEVNESILNNEYLYYYFRKIKNFFLEKSSQTTLPILNKSQCKEIQIPLPPLPRQHEIVAHLDRVFAETEALRGEYEAQIRNLETLRQSLLEEAFAGRLVTD